MRSLLWLENLLVVGSSSSSAAASFAGGHEPAMSWNAMRGTDAENESRMPFLSVNGASALLRRGQNGMTEVSFTSLTRVSWEEALSARLGSMLYSLIHDQGAKENEEPKRTMRAGRSCGERASH